MQQTDPWKSLAYYQHDPGIGKTLAALVLAMIGVGIWLTGTDIASPSFTPTTTNVIGEAGEQLNQPEG
ncbi:MAG: hypothetical protein AAF962_18980 [Actinomycetota bacterium]